MYSSTIFVVNGGEWSVSFPTHFIPTEPPQYLLNDRMWSREECLAPSGNRTLVSRSSRPQPGHYTD
jgi:hypothetical protein